MKYFLWIDGKQAGPYEPEQIREMLGKGRIAAVTLGHSPKDEARQCGLNPSRSCSEKCRVVC
jgi:hypothetical protein